VTAARRFLLGFFLAATAVGAFFRLFHYRFQRPLWMDEAILAINIPIRSYLEFLKPLDYNTSAPFPFLWAERALVGVLGTGELSLRALPLLAGLWLVPAIGLLARRLFGDIGALAAVLIAALSPTLIRFSNEVKPYGTDALVSVLLIGAALHAAQAPDPRRAWRPLLWLAPIGILCSYPAVFVVAAAWLSLALSPSAWRNRKQPLLLCAGLCAVAFAVPYFGIYAKAASSPELQGAWNAAFLEPNPDLPRRLQLALPGLLLPTFLGNGAQAPAHGLASLAVIAALLALGLWETGRRHGLPAVVLLAGPVALAALASALRRYPFGVPRLMVFAVPTLILLAAAACVFVHSRLACRVHPLLLLMALLTAALPTLRDDVAGVRAPFLGEDSRALITAYRKARRGEQEPIYVSAKALPSWVFYSTNWEAPRLDRLRFYAEAGTHGLAFENRPSRGRPVVDEGLDLVYDFRGRREILGTASGREWRWPAYLGSDPDPGWAANEARRIKREAASNPDSPCAWVLFTRLSERSNLPLAWQLRNVEGGVREFWLQVAGGVLYRFCFPQPGTTPPTEDNDPSV
jgi:hypothetical protein